jgi:hypothetical protein
MIYGESNEGAGISSLLQSTHLWTEPHDAVAARQVNLYNRVGRRPSCGRSAMQSETEQRGMLRSWPVCHA